MAKQKMNIKDVMRDLKTAKAEYRIKYNKDYEAISHYGIYSKRHIKDIQTIAHIEGIIEALKDERIKS